MPLLQLAVPLHARPQVPQLDGSVLGLTHPLAAPQNVSPNAVQRQLRELGSQYWSMAHTSPQPAQFIASMATQRPAHSRVPTGHAHATPSQTWSLRHVTPQAPQFVASLGTQTSPQMMPLSHRHTPVEQISPLRQVRPQTPQLVVSE